MKIYTKTGDQGTTSLFGGKRVDKDDLRIDAYGNLDELNSLIGVIVVGLETQGANVKEKSSLHVFLISKLTRIQNELMVMGSDLSCPLDVKVKVPRVNKAYAMRLEKEIDQLEKKLPPLKNFILPGGSIISSWLHLARSTARRAERSAVKLSKSEKINNHALVYLNRLSDWFFVISRYAALEQKAMEKIWKGRIR